MKKLVLRLEALTVQSFVAGESRGCGGTVHGHATTRGCPTGSPFNCPDTEWPSCGIVCLPTLETNPCNC